MSIITRPVWPIRSHPFLSFTVLACLLGWAFIIAAAMGADIASEANPLGPLMAAALVAAGLGREEPRAWGRRLLTFRASPAWYALALLAPAVIVVAAVLANHAFGAPLPTSTQLAGWTALPGTFAGILVLIGIGEEAGWTAFAASRLLDRHPFLTAWLLLSAARVLWHLPLMLAGQLPWVLGIGGNIAFQFLVLWIFARSGRVWFLAALWHAMLNTLGGQFFFRMVQAGPDQARLGLLMSLGYVLAAMAVFLANRRRIGDRPGGRP